MRFVCAYMLCDELPSCVFYIFICLPGTAVVVWSSGCPILLDCAHVLYLMSDMVYNTTILPESAVQK